MSRTYRHTPIVKAGKDNSNREFKVASHKALRREAKAALIHEDPEELLAPVKLHEVSEIWSSKQEYKWKEFGNFWEHCNQRLAELQAVSPYYRMKKYINRYWKQCERSFKRMFYR